MNQVASITPLGGFRLRVRFSDGSEGTHDFSALVKEPGPCSIACAMRAYFARVFLEFGALTWPNGYDMCPDWLRGEMEAAGESTTPVGRHVGHRTRGIHTNSAKLWL